MKNVFYALFLSLLVISSSVNVFATDDDKNVFDPDVPSHAYVSFTCEKDDQFYDGANHFQLSLEITGVKSNDLPRISACQFDAFGNRLAVPMIVCNGTVSLKGHKAALFQNQEKETSEDISEKRDCGSFNDSLESDDFGFSPLSNFVFIPLASEVPKGVHFNYSYKNIPLFSSYESARQYVYTGEVNDDDYIGTTPDDSIDNTINLSQDEFAPPVLSKIKHYTYQNLVSAATQVSGSVPPLFSCDIENVNDGEFKTDSKLEIAISGKYMKSDIPIVADELKLVSRIDADVKRSSIYSGQQISSVSFPLLEKSMKGVGTPKFIDSEFSNLYFSYLNTNGLNYQIGHVNSYTGSYFCPNEEKFWFRYVCEKDGKTYSSDWVCNSISFEESIKNPLDPTKTTTTDNDGNDTENKYNNSSNSQNGISDVSGFFDWLSNLLRSVGGFFSSITDTFNSAVTSGSSFVSMFKAYNSWLPVGFISLLVTFLAIAMFLRIVGR